MARKRIDDTDEDLGILPAGEKLAHIPEQIQLTPEEIQAILAAREAKAAPAIDSNGAVGIETLTKALVDAINTTKPPEKKTMYTRKRLSPYFPQDGSPKLRLKRKMFQHGIQLNDDMLHNSTVEKLNRIKPGKYCEGFVIVRKRRDNGIDIDYPVRTAAQRLKLVNNFSVSKFEDLVDRILDERTNPHKYRRADDMDDDE